MGAGKNLLKSSLGIIVIMNKSSIFMHVSALIYCTCHKLNWLTKQPCLLTQMEKASGFQTTLSQIVFLCLWSCRPEEKIKILEKKVNDLIEESCMAHSMGSLQLVRLCSCLTKYLVKVAPWIWREGPPS